MKIVLYMGMSVNGFISNIDDETPWSLPIWDSYYSLASGFPAIILGRKTYDLMLQADEFDKIGNPFTAVLTRSTHKGDEKTVFCSTVNDCLTAMRDRGYSAVLLGGGSLTNAAFLDAGFVDEIILDVEPLVIRSGKPLTAALSHDIKLKLESSKVIAEGIIQLRYSVLK